MSPLRPSKPSSHRSGFTLMEMVIALGVLGLLMAGIFGVAKSTMELSSDLAASQERAMMRQNLIDYLRRSFRSLPGSAEIRLQNRSVGGTYIPSLTIVNGGNSFSPGDALPPETGLELTAEQRPGGYLRVMLRFLDDQQTLALRSGQNMRASKNDSPLTLMDQVSQFEWKFYDPQTQRWENVWKDARRPLMAEMVVQLDDGKSMRAVFWIPPVIPIQTPVNPTPNPAAAPGGANPPPPGSPPPPVPGNP